MSEYDKQEIASLKRENARLKARIEELESGRAEPKAAQVKKKSKR
jgi:cell division protein FtsB